VVIVQELVGNEMKLKKLLQTEGRYSKDKNNNLYFDGSPTPYSDYGGLLRLNDDDDYSSMPKCKLPKNSKCLSFNDEVIQILLKLRDMGVTEEMVQKSKILRS